MGGQGLRFASSLRCVLTNSAKSIISHALLHESTCTSRPAAPEMVPRPAAVVEAPSPDGRVLSGLASSCLAYGAAVALRSSACMWSRSDRFLWEQKVAKKVKVLWQLLVGNFGQ